MKKWKILLILFGVGYGVIYLQLTKPILAEPEASLEAASDAKQKVIQGMAAYVEKGQEKSDLLAKNNTKSITRAKRFYPAEKPIEVGSFELNDQLRDQLSTPEGITAFTKQIGNRATPMAADVELAFKKDHFRNPDEQNTLLDLAHALARVTDGSMMTERLATEAKRYLIPSEDMDDAYGGRALQYYLDVETNPEKRTDLVKSLHPDPSANSTN